MVWEGFSLIHSFYLAVNTIATRKQPKKPNWVSILVSVQPSWSWDTCRKERNICQKRRLSKTLPLILSLLLACMPKVINPWPGLTLEFGMKWWKRFKELSCHKFQILWCTFICNVPGLVGRVESEWFENSQISLTKISFWQELSATLAYIFQNSVHVLLPKCVCVVSKVRSWP